MIIKKKEAGAKDKAPVMLQGHIDMVCDKLAGVEHDFEKDGLDLIVKTAFFTQTERLSEQTTGSGCPYDDSS